MTTVKEWETRRGNVRRREISLVGKTGGEKTHVLTVDEMPKHRHTVRKFATMQGGGSWDGDKIGGAQRNDAATGNGYTEYSGTSKAHNNMPPYIAVYLWRRTA